LWTRDKSENMDPVVRRLRRYEVSEGKTWREVADKLGVSLSMIMMVQRGERRLSAKALYRLEEAEREAAERKTLAERAVEGLMGAQGAGGDWGKGGSLKGGILEFPVHYSNARAKKSLPDRVTLRRPPAEGCVELRQLFAQTMDPAMILLACLPDTLRSERFLGQLSPDSRMRLTTGALGLVMPDWRSLVASSVAGPSASP
jgi:transcriptional regulator with XRE-family HTH domain